MGGSRFYLDPCCGVPGAFRSFIVAVTVLAGLSSFTTTSAQAGAWIPAMGHGCIEPMLRFSTASRSFPIGSFSTATAPSSNERTDQFRVVGEHGLGRRFSLDYDLRYANETRSKTKHGVTISTDRSGLEDGRIGLNYGALQTKRLAEAAGLGVVFPGTSVDAASALSSGQWAVEPVYRLGFKPGLWNLTATLDMASRVFLDGGAAQFRTDVEVSAPVFHRINLIGKLFLVRSVRMSSYNEVRDRSELYDLLRLGVGARFHLTKHIEPIILYESAIAGMSRHAGQRITIGMKITY